MAGTSTLLHTGCCNTTIPARMPSTPPTSFQPHKELSRKMLTIRKRPPTSQKMPNTCIRTNSVAPGAVSRNRPMIAAAIPSSKTSHQGELVSSVPSTNAVIVVAPFFLDFFLVEDFFLETSLCLTNVGATSSYNLQLTLLSLCPPSFAWLTTPQRDRIRGRHHLRSAGGAVERPVGQRAHLGVAALLAGVCGEDVWKGNYLLERPYEGAVEGAAAGLALSRAREWPPTPRAQRAVSARWAD